MEWPYLRKYPRTKANITVGCRQDGEKFLARAFTLAGGGLVLTTTRPIPLGSKLTVRFRPARHLPQVEAKAEVREQLPGEGIGIEFTEIKPEDRQEILRFILHRMTERRRYPRAPLVTQIEREADVSLGLSRTIGVGGMFIETNEPPADGSTVTVRFHLDDGGAMISVSAVVRYLVTNLGIGVEFLDLPPADVTRIDVYVTKGQLSRQPGREIATGGS